MDLFALNRLSDSDFYRKLYKCCSSVRFAERITLLRPFESVDQLFAACDRVWLVELDSNDWKESFKAHPRIGDKEELRKKLAGVKSMEGEEQAGAASASEEVLDALARGNDEYEQKFGFIFLICATGKSADEMLEALNKRMSNSIDDEVVISAKEQGKITRLRVTKLAQELIHSCAKL